MILPSRVLVSIFQSTLPLRGATGHTRHHPNIPCYFNPHSPCGERPRNSSYACRPIHFNPHSPCGERLAYTYATPSLIWTLFQSTLPLRGATSTIGSGVSGLVQFQSTLPLRGATWSVPCRPSSWCNFNPHSPCGERQKIPHRPLRLHYFNPHSPCGERPTGWGAYRIRHEFQSTLPLRGATRRTRAASRHLSISIHTPLAGSDRARTDRWSRQRISIHTPLAGSDSPSQDSISDQREFQSTLPLRGATLQPCGTLIFK